MNVYLSQVADLCTFMGQAFTLNPDLQYTILTYRVDMAAFTCAPERGHWQRVVRELKLTQQQLDEVAVFWEISNKDIVSTRLGRCLQ